MPNATVTFRPLTQWPAGRAKTPDWQREDAKFRAGGRAQSDGMGSQRWVQGERTSVEKTYDELDRELWSIGATEVVVQVDMAESDLRRDGTGPRADRRGMSPAVVLSFKRKGTLHTFACDRFQRWQDNLRGIVLGLDGLRRLERYGIVQSGEQYRGWQALPSSTTPALSTEQAADILARRLNQNGPAGMYTAAAIVRDRTSAQSAVRAARAKAHPDAGGSSNDFTLVQEAARVLGLHHGVSL